MNTTEIGNRLEDQLYDYLHDQLDRGELVFDVYPANLCELHKKKKYYCEARKRNVEFDVVIEVCRKPASEPHVVVIFECKNHQKPVQERDITDFSSKVGDIFGHGAKGMVVSSSRLQSGAENFARSRRIGIVKFDEDGIDVIADRKGGTWAENSFVETQIFENARRSKSLKFSAYSEGRFFGSAIQLLQSFEPNFAEEGDTTFSPQSKSVAFVPDKEIRETSRKSLKLLGHDSGAVDLEKLCAELDLQLTFSKRLSHDADGNPILGSANFGKRSIEVNLHGNRHRERFTIAHEIGHFCLRHEQYLYSETIVEHDLLVGAQSEVTCNYERLEYQANIFASELLLPYEDFQFSVEALRLHVGIYDRGFGYIYVDDQPCNYTPFNEMMSLLSNHFDVSKQAIEIRLKRMGLLTDRRGNNQLSQFRSSVWQPGR